MRAIATFELANPTDGPLFAAELDGAPSGSRSYDKTFTGELDGSSVVQMLSAGDPGAGGAGYVALELVSATVGGATGTFVLLHAGTMDGDAEPWATWKVVPGSGTGGLAGIRGTGLIRFEDDGTHVFELDYELGAS